MGLKRLVKAWAKGFQAETDRLTEEAEKLKELNDRSRSEIEQIRAETKLLQKGRIESQDSQTKPVSQNENTLTIRFAKDVLEMEASIDALGSPDLRERGRAFVYDFFRLQANNPQEATFLERHLGPGKAFS